MSPWSQVALQTVSATFLLSPFPYWAILFTVSLCRPRARQGRVFVVLCPSTQHSEEQRAGFWIGWKQKERRKGRKEKKRMRGGKRKL